MKTRCWSTDDGSRAAELSTVGNATCPCLGCMRSSSLLAQSCVCCTQPQSMCQTHMQLLVNRSPPATTQRVRPMGKPCRLGGRGHYNSQQCRAHRIKRAGHCVQKAQNAADQRHPANHAAMPFPSQPSSDACTHVDACTQAGEGVWAAWLSHLQNAAQAQQCVRLRRPCPSRSHAEQHHKQAFQPLSCTHQTAG